MREMAPSTPAVGFSLTSPVMAIPFWVSPTVPPFSAHNIPRTLLEVTSQVKGFMTILYYAIALKVASLMTGYAVIGG